MDDKAINQAIGYALLAILAYWILQMVVPFLIYGVLGFVVWRAYQVFEKLNK